MVKTRSCKQNKKQITPPQYTTNKHNKTHKSATPKTVITSQHLRDRIRAKISKTNKGKHPKTTKVVHFGKNQFTAITSPQKFHCPICLEIMIFPAISQCGHAFCLPCIEESLNHKHACSLCREALTFEQFKESLLIKEILDRVVTQALTREEMQQYNDRVKAFEAKDQERRVSTDAVVGDRVDFYMEDSWHEGVITRKQQGEDSTTLTVKSTQNEELTRELSLASRLLAKNHTFTKEKSLFHSLMGQFRLQISAFAEMPFTALSQLELYPITYRRGFEDGDIMRITFSFDPPEDN